MEEQRHAVPMAGRMQPHRDEVLGNSRLRVVESPLLDALMARIRDRRTPSPEFARLVGTVGHALILNACRAAATMQDHVFGFDGSPIRVRQLAERIAAVVILRAGLVFADPFRALNPDGAIHQIGAQRNEATLDASIYTENLPNQPGWADRVLLLDPMLATGGSALVALELIRQTHGGPLTIVSLVSAPLGVAAVLAADPHCDIVTAALDERLDENGYIRPGLGDAGDRLFGTSG